MSKKRTFWKLGIESTATYRAIFCGLFTLHFCRCGSCFLPLLLSHRETVEVKTRTCGFCFRRFTYDNAPYGSICYLGIFACGCCLKTEKTAEFRKLMDSHDNATIEWK